MHEAMVIYGINPVLEALRAERVTSISVSPRADDRLTQVVRLAEEQGVAVRRVSLDELDRLAGGAAQRHQGVVADVQESAHYSVEDLVIGARSAPLIVVLDSIEDPHNVGAILRSLDAAGALRGRTAARPKMSTMRGCGQPRVSGRGDDRPSLQALAEWHGTC